MNSKNVYDFATFYPQELPGTQFVSTVNTFHKQVLEVVKYLSHPNNKVRIQEFPQRLSTTGVQLFK